MCALLLLASLLRLGWPDISEFKSDEAHIARVAYDLATGRSIPLQGTGTAIGLPKSPLSVYLYALPSLLWRNPLWLTWFTAALNVLAVALCWWFGRRYWGPGGAGCAALLLATNPWAIHFSRKIWEPNLLPLFVLAWAATGASVFTEGRRWPLVLHLILLSASIQLHYSALTLIPVTALFLISHRSRLGRGYLVAGLALATALAIPFLLYLSAPSSRTRWGNALQLPSTLRFEVQSLRFWWVMASGGEIHALAGPAAYQEFLRTLPPLGAVPKILGALAVAGLCICLWRGRQQGEDRGGTAALLVASWGLAPLVLFAWQPFPVHLHYYVISMPAQCLAAGSAVACLGHRIRPTLRRGLFMVVLWLGVAQAGVWLALLSFMGTHATPGGFGMPLGLQMRAAQRAVAAGVPVTVVSLGDDPAFGDWPAVFDVLLDSLPHRLVDGSRAAVFAAQPSVILATPGTSTALRLYSQAGLSQAGERIAARTDEEPFHILHLNGGEHPPLVPASGPSQLANGVEIVGHAENTAIVPGQPLNWVIAWRVRQVPIDRHTTYHLFNHLLDARGERWSQADGPTLATEAWTEGDLVVQAFEMMVPAEAGPAPFHMRVGMYTYPGLQAQPVLDETGQPIAEAVLLGPLVQTD
ncbi:MAG: hypothetical protein FJ026_02715 [Chloroflexi bacterium]|nr:hypothetical protein [Chloroflexota bacterium]